MRCYPKQHKLSCGIDLQARRMSGCVLKEDGALVMHRHRQARPAPLLRTVAPDRDDLVGAVACGLPWDGLAALWAQEGMPFVRGHARALPALHRGPAPAGGRLPRAAACAPRPRAAPPVSRTHTGGAPGTPPEHPSPVPRARERPTAGRQSHPRWRRRALPRSRRPAEPGRGARPERLLRPPAPRRGAAERPRGPAARCPAAGLAPDRARERATPAPRPALRDA